MKVTMAIRGCDVDTRRDEVDGQPVVEWESCCGRGDLVPGHCTYRRCDGVVFTLADGTTRHAPGGVEVRVTRMLGWVR